MKATRGAYFAEFNWYLPPGKSTDWSLIANLDQDVGDVARLSKDLQDRAILKSKLYQDLKQGNAELRQIVASADGYQHTRDNAHDQRHLLNALFNAQRGGIPVAQTTIQKSDLQDYVRTRNISLANAPYWKSLPPQLDLVQLPDCDNPQLRRLLIEYMPLGYSRRHGDPSRPWNRFNIETRDAKGNVRLHYEGNWRDVFQNWEALACSFPFLLTRMIATFVNGSTADGYNPYRIGREGIDWEIPDPKDPGPISDTGGDHQIVYLLRLLEQAQAHDPDLLTELLTERIFSYANVPYQLRSYQEIQRDPHHSIDFDATLNDAIQAV